MIPKADTVAWRQFAPWVNDAQVEQVLIISRALVAIFQNPVLAERIRRHPLLEWQAINVRG